MLRTQSMDRNGIFSWYGIKLPFQKRITQIQQAGFAATSIWFGPEEALFRAGNEDALASIVRDAGLYLENIHSPYQQVNRLWDPQHTAAWKQQLQAEIHYCRKHSIPLLVTHLTKGYHIQDVNKYGLETLRAVVRSAEDNGVIIAVENTRCEQILTKVFQTIRSPYLGLCYDSSHDFLYSKSPCTLLQTHGERLVCLHLSDNNGDKDDHSLPFQGTIDWQKLFTSLPSDYRGYYMLEVFPQNKGETIEFLEKAYTTISILQKGQFF